MAISGHTDIEGKNFDIVQDICAISGYTNTKVFPLISKIWSILGTICHTWGTQLPEACRLMTWRQDHTRSCQARGNNNPGTSFSAIAKKMKINLWPFSQLQGRLLQIKTLREFFWDTSSRL
jgi:hypothetical protein